MPEAAAAAKGGTSDPLRLSRRRIYFNRLIGDNVLTSRMTHRRRESGWVVLKFICYAGLAALVIAGRSDIEVQNKVNSAITTALKRRPFKTGPPASYFEDIFTVNDMTEWITYSVLPQLFLREPFSEKYSFFSFNRLLQIYNSSEANIRITMRKMATEPSGDSSTTSRFQPLYDKTWKNFEISEQKGFSDDDDTANVYGIYTFDEPVEGVSYPYIGTNEYDNPIELWTDLEKDDPVKVTWKYSMNAGYKDRGGYVALIDLAVNQVHTDILNELAADNSVDFNEIADGIIGDQLVRLLEFGDAEKVATEGLKNEATPPPPPSTAKMRLANFFEGGLMDATTSNVILEFQTYNANYQTLSYVQVTFSWNAAGALNQKNIQVDTVKIEYPQNSYLHILEYIYAVTTGYYFLQQLISFYKLRKAWFFDAWSYIDLGSTIFSFLSLYWWAGYEEEGLKMVEMYQTFPTLEFVQKRISEFQKYSRISSCATLSIFIRINKFLAGSVSRVKLLQHTMALSAFQMFVYIMWIVVVFFGFVAVANTNFAPHSENFASIGYTMITCWGMFLGDIEPMGEVTNASLYLVYFVPFMLFFYFISVQMFNAIINYSYNKASEDMEPIFEKERQEKKRREKSKKQSAGLLTNIRAFCNKHRKKKAKTTGGDAAAAEQGKEDQSKTKAAGGGKDMSLDSLDPAVKEQVEAYLNKDKDHAAADSSLDIVRFLLFSFAYIYFLSDNLWVPKNYQLNYSVRDAITRASTNVMNSDGDYLYTNYNDVHSIYDLSVWITEVLPLVIYEGSKAPPQYNSQSTNPSKLPKAGETIIPPGQFCINGWNCLLQGSESIPPMIRITQRKVTRKPNDDPFVMGGKAAVAFRRHDSGIDSKGERDESHELITGEESQIFQVNGVPFCNWAPSGGFMNLGGLQCLLAADKDLHEKQLETMKQDFVSINTGTIVVEFVGYNGNADMLIYSGWHFKIGSQGVVEKSPENLAFVFKDYSQISAILGLVPGVIYAGLVFYYASRELGDIRKEAIRKKSREDKNFATAFIEHFTQDFFSILNVSSIWLSLFSIVLFVNFFRTQLAFGENMNVSFPDFVTFVSDLGATNKLYVRLSSVNVLVIFLRVLKFFRENPRMNKLNQTLWLAKTDIAWFVVMLFIIMFGFVMFAYVSFGGKIGGLSNLGGAVQYCFEFQLGNFNFWELYAIDQIMAVVFFFPYLILFYCVFMNIFFAIVDRFFVTATPPPVNIKRKLKPFLGRICRCIQWDEDYDMEADPNQEKKSGPPSRKDRVQQTAMTIEDMRTKAAGLGADAIAPKKARTLNEVCELDERMTEVIHWGRDEAKKFIEKYQRLLSKKQESSAKEERFIQTEVMTEVERELEHEEKNMESCKRAVRYALLVHEKMTAQDQEMLSKYILLLEYKIQKKMVEQHALEAEVAHLRLEAELMRFTEDQLKENEENRGDGGGGGDKFQAGKMLEKSAEKKKARAQAVDEGEEDASPALGDGEQPADEDEMEQGEPKAPVNLNDPERLMEEDGPEHKEEMKRQLHKKLTENMESK